MIRAADLRDGLFAQSLGYAPHDLNAGARRYRHRWSDRAGHAVLGQPIDGAVARRALALKHIVVSG